jgi:hypothetical protein
MRIPAGFHASTDDQDRGRGQRPYGRRCGESCTASTNAQQAGSGALISSDSGLLTTGALVADTATERGTLSFSANAGDVLFAWSNVWLSDPAAAFGGLLMEIRLDDVQQQAQDEMQMGWNGALTDNVPPTAAFAEIAILSTGTHTVDVWLTAQGGAATLSYGQFGYLLHRQPPTA